MPNVCNYECNQWHNFDFLQMTENDSHFYCGTTTGDVLEVDKNLHIEADESLTWQNRDLTA